MPPMPSLDTINQHLYRGTSTKQLYSPTPLSPSQSTARLGASPLGRVSISVERPAALPSPKRLGLAPSPLPMRSLDANPKPARLNQLRQVQSPRRSFSLPKPCQGETPSPTLSGNSLYSPRSPSASTLSPATFSSVDDGPEHKVTTMGWRGRPIFPGVKRQSLDASQRFGNETPQSPGSPTRRKGLRKQISLSALHHAVGSPSIRTSRSSRALSPPRTISTVAEQPGSVTTDEPVAHQWEVEESVQSHGLSPRPSRGMIKRAFRQPGSPSEALSPSFGHPLQPRQAGHGVPCASIAATSQRRETSPDLVPESARASRDTTRPHAERIAEVMDKLGLTTLPEAQSPLPGPQTGRVLPSPQPAASGSKYAGQVPHGAADIDALAALLPSAGKDKAGWDPSPRPSPRPEPESEPAWPGPQTSNRKKHMGCMPLPLQHQQRSACKPFQYTAQVEDGARTGHDGLCLPSPRDDVGRPSVAGAPHLPPCPHVRRTGRGRAETAAALSPPYARPALLRVRARSIEPMRQPRDSPP